MSAPRLQIDLDKIFHNASTLVTELGARGISTTGVTKAFCGAPRIAKTLLRAGVSSLGDSRIENIELMRQSGIVAQMMLIRSPMLSQAERVVKAADISFNTEPEVLAALSVAAQKARKTHGVLLMVELGDLREGLMPNDVEDAVRSTCNLPNINFMGLGTNLACRNGVSPDNGNMAELSSLAARVARICQKEPNIISGGNSSNLDWVFSKGKIGRINNLRLGEAILLGRQPINRQPIDGLFTDAISLIAEVIESKAKPSKPWGKIGQSAFLNNSKSADVGTIEQAIIAVGQQDIDPDGLIPPAGISVLSASSDHLILSSGRNRLAVGSEVCFQLNYSALLRAMTSPYISTHFIDVRAIDGPCSTRQICQDAA